MGGNTALMAACEFGYLDAARALVAAGANVNAKDAEGSTPLISATIASMGAPGAPLIKLLLDHGANPNVGSEPPLLWAASTGNRQAVQFLLDKGAKANVYGRSGTPLLSVLMEGGLQRAMMVVYGLGGTMTEEQRNAARQSAEKNDADIVRALLDHGVDVTKGPDRGALILAAGRGNTTIVQLLLDKGAAINITDVEAPIPPESLMDEEVQAVTPLIIAAANGHPGVVGLLLEKGADVKAKDKSGQTALMRVAAAGRAQTVRMLPRMREAILHRVNDDTDKPVSPEVSAKENSAWQKWADDGDTRVVEALLAKNADINARDAQGRTALMQAAANSTPAVLQALIQAKADLNTQDAKGETALMHVVEYGRVQRAPELFSQELQSAVAFADRPGSPTQKAVVAAKAALDRQKTVVLQQETKADLAMLQILIDGGADTNLHDKKGRTLLSIATQMHLTDFVNFLKQNGAKP
jgi:ankyrin repeat protein